VVQRIELNLQQHHPKICSDVQDGKREGVKIGTFLLLSPQHHKAAESLHTTPTHLMAPD